MNAINQYCVRRALRFAIVAVGSICGVYGQTQINLGTQGRNVDFSNAPSTRPVKTGTALPATCSVGDLFFQSSAPQGENLYGCSTVNTWALLGGGASVLFYQTFESNGAALTEQPALNFSSAFSASDNSASSRTDVDLATVNSNVGTFGSSSQVPVITVNGYGLITGVSSAAITGGGGGATTWGSITGTLSGQTDLQAVLNGKQATGSYVTALTGDVTASGPGSASATLATVNSGAGQCGDSTHVCQVTTDGKGRVTAQAVVPISASGTGTVTHTGGVLAADQLIVGNGSGDIITGDLSGDIETSGSTTTTLATVNTNTGACGDSTHVCQVTLDGKGRATAATQVAISGSGGGLSLATQLLDFAPVISGGTVTFGASCSSGTPCVYYSSGTRYAFTTSAIVAPLSGTDGDTLYFYGDGSGILNIGYNSANTYTFTRATGVPTTTSFPAGAYPLFKCTVAGGAVVSCNDEREILALTNFAAGQGTSIGQSGGAVSINITETVDLVAATNYTVPGTVCGHLELATTSSAGIWSLPQPGVGGMMTNGCVIEFKPTAATITLTPTTSTIDGGPTKAIAATHSCRVISDGANYQSVGCN